MDRITGVTKNHDWGSSTLIPEFLGTTGSGEPWAEQWFGAHELGPAQLESGSNLRDQIECAPAVMLGPSTQLMFGDQLPYLVKLIAPTLALSLQVHPGRNLAAQGFAHEDASGVPVDSPQRIFKDTTHKPEMLYALTEFEALVGFAVRRRARERLEGLNSTLASRLARRLRLATGRGIKPVISWILDPEEGPRPEEVAEFARACGARLASGESPEPEIDSIVVRLQEQFPGESGIIMCSLMNYVSLAPGSALFVPTGIVHSYQSGLGLEVMANSDNVIRAGLTSKRIDPELFLDTATFDGLPPTLIAPEHPLPGINRFRSPVEDFELSVAASPVPNTSEPIRMPGTGPRVLVGLEGRIQVQTLQGDTELRQGQALFVPDCDGPILVTGQGRVAEVSVP
ncbi:mannose-6-phosphate isomerase, class I [Actinomyces minihominis]|uniref:mannose-6-phosphate isomerase, class I n=1 Tax=Actinomyces minihominis TaxID=2002838 RepID=UPI000C081B47|nr:mannose-6-phosphate isomerase, class I [Actinomyces minihominis]